MNRGFGKNKRQRRTLTEWWAADRSGHHDSHSIRIAAILALAAPVLSTEASAQKGGVPGGAPAAPAMRSAPAAPAIRAAPCCASRSRRRHPRRPLSALHPLRRAWSRRSAPRVAPSAPRMAPASVQRRAVVTPRRPASIVRAPVRASSWRPRRRSANSSDRERRPRSATSRIAPQTPVATAWSLMGSRRSRDRQFPATDAANGPRSARARGLDESGACKAGRRRAGASRQSGVRGKVRSGCRTRDFRLDATRTRSSVPSIAVTSIAVLRPRLRRPAVLALCL